MIVGFITRLIISNIQVDLVETLVHFQLIYFAVFNLSVNNNFISKKISRKIALFPKEASILLFKTPLKGLDFSFKEKYTFRAW